MPIADARHEAAKRMMSRRGKIVESPDGSPIRTLKNFSPMIPSGRYMSVKCGRPMDWEAFHERHLFWICEADANVTGYLSQPHRLEMLLKGRSKPLVYYPDVMRKFADGTVEIVETKKTLEELTDDPEYELKLEFAKTVYEENRGWTFRVMTAEDDIEIEPLLSNARLIKRNAPTRVRTIDKIKLLEALAGAGGTLPYDTAVEAIRRWGVDRRTATAKLHAMIVKRLAAIDIARTISPNTPVRAIADVQTVLPRKRTNQ